MEGLHLVIAITEREWDADVLKIFQENNVFITNVALGEGTAPADILDYLYLSPSEKSITFGIITNTGLLPLIKSFKPKMRIDFPGNGIVVCIPVNSVGGRRSLEYILEGQSIDLSSKDDAQTEREEPMAVNTDYEMIFVIANEGYTDLIMEKSGLDSKAQSIVFSLPVSHAIGLQLPEE